MAGSMMQFLAQVAASGHDERERDDALPVLQDVVVLERVWMSRYSKSRTTEVFWATQPADVVHFHVGSRGWTSAVEGGDWASEGDIPRERSTPTPTRVVDDDDDNMLLYVVVAR